MKISIQKDELFKYFNGFSAEKVNNLKDITIKAENKKLKFYSSSTLVASLAIKTRLHLEDYESKILALYKPKKSKKTIIFEAFCSEEAKTVLYHERKQFNEVIYHKSPLESDFALKARASHFSDPENPADFRGFINLFILFSVLNYSRLIAEHTLKYKSVFSANVY